MNQPDDVLIIGGGVIGLASALALLDAGRGVRVLEASAVGSGSSHGNCGTITPSHAAPLAEPGAVAKALRWMLTPDAPFYLRPRLDRELWSWALHFASRCNAGHWRSAMVSRATLLKASRQWLPQWVERYGLDCEYAEEGVDYVFRDARVLEHFAKELPPLAELGIASEAIDGAEYLRRESALREGVRGAIRFPGDARLRPDRYVAGLARAVRAAGGLIEEDCRVQGIREDDDRVRASTPRGDFEGRELVVATGAWSPLLARATGLARIPLQPGKGYSITYDRPALAPKQPIVLYERSVCVTVWDSGYRLGSTMEFSGYDETLNRRRLDALERGAREYLHEPVGPVKREEWYGWRPIAADDIPLIGRSPRHRHVWLATGHGMLGVSMSTGTGELVADLVCGRTPHFDPAPYAPERFA
ncbi:NAD(P)/FAD-dependent oxidoreductase [Luteimonas aquatica]|uniref:NAD(P)/FAD-dependent oxidoreductase n=1 Tax=Luteimonas aquatica TaxID=450364 RepID=UPI001F58E4B3|nr:FAD-dependent oxidoreductase [Luteimonas aquatica]